MDVLVLLMLLAVLLTGLALVLGVALLVRSRRARRHRDDMLRAHPSGGLTAEQAALRGGGRSSWMRPAGS